MDTEEIATTVKETARRASVTMKDFVTTSCSWTFTEYEQAHLVQLNISPVTGDRQILLDGHVAVDATSNPMTETFDTITVNASPVAGESAGRTLYVLTVKTIPGVTGYLYEVKVNDELISDPNEPTAFDEFTEKLENMAESVSVTTSEFLEETSKKSEILINKITDSTPSQRRQSIEGAVFLRRVYSYSYYVY